jgi:hypothetical protein
VVSEVVSDSAPDFVLLLKGGEQFFLAVAFGPGLAGLVPVSPLDLAGGSVVCNAALKAWYMDRGGQHAESDAGFVERFKGAFGGQREARKQFVVTFGFHCEANITSLAGTSVRFAHIFPEGAGKSFGKTFGGHSGFVGYLCGDAESLANGILD